MKGRSYIVNLSLGIICIEKVNAVSLQLDQLSQAEHLCRQPHQPPIKTWKVSSPGRTFSLPCQSLTVPLTLGVHTHVHPHTRAHIHACPLRTL